MRPRFNANGDFASVQTGCDQIPRLHIQRLIINALKSDVIETGDTAHGTYTTVSIVDGQIVAVELPVNGHAR